MTGQNKQEVLWSIAKACKHLLPSTIYHWSMLMWMVAVGMRVKTSQYSASNPHHCSPPINVFWEKKLHVGNKHIPHWDIIYFKLFLADKFSIHKKKKNSFFFFFFTKSGGKYAQIKDCLQAKMFQICGWTDVRGHQRWTFSLEEVELWIIDYGLDFYFMLFWLYFFVSFIRKFTIKT